jgi:hypothetical protein
LIRLETIGKELEISTNGVRGAQGRTVVVEEEGALAGSGGKTKGVRSTCIKQSTKM